ncbi:MAG: capsule assembly Wzi family protein [Gemmatimonadetes bacterium]|nr:capsule assembly Wzi family protein [Gemmatimonadota bacterium]
MVRTAAVTNPLLAYDEGRPTVEGATFGLEIEGGFDPGRRAALVVRPRIQAGFAATGARDTQPVFLREIYGRLLLGKAALTVGRAPVTWGQGLSGGLLLSHNPAPLTMVGASTDRGVVLPGFLRFLGPSHHQFFVAELGEEGRTHPHALLINLRSSFRPHDRVEVGVGLLNQQGGEGAPGATLLERVADVLIVPDLLRSGGDYQFSQKMALADLRVRFPDAGGLEVWLEAVLDDFDLGRVGSMLWEDGGWLLGARLARLDDAGHVSLAVEGQHTGVRFYGHLDFAGGVTLDRRVLGSELGMAGDGLYARLALDRGGPWSFALDGAWERRSNDRYRLVESPPDLVRTAVLPKEERWRTVLAGERLGDGGAWSVGLQAGYELARRFAFRAGDTRHSVLLRMVAVARVP